MARRSWTRPPLRKPLSVHTCTGGCWATTYLTLGHGTKQDLARLIVLDDKRRSKTGNAYSDAAALVRLGRTTTDALPTASIHMQISLLRHGRPREAELPGLRDSGS